MCRKEIQPSAHSTCKKHSARISALHLAFEREHVELGRHFIPDLCYYKTYLKVFRMQKKLFYNIQLEKYCTQFHLAILQSAST